MNVIPCLLSCVLFLKLIFIIPLISLTSSQSLSAAALAGSSTGHHVCRHLRGLVKKQKKICKQYPQLMASVVHGYMIGIRECQWQFKHRQWNCSATTGDHTKSVFSTILDKGTKEAAYVLAVTSAGVSYSVTRACSTGVHASCGCDRTIYDVKHSKKHRWSGCSDNIHFGDAFARRFIDSYERRTMRRNPGLAMMKLHNNAVGRLSLYDEMRIKCKCHGVSGSCELRTCWRALPSFRDIGIELQNRFDKAAEVKYAGRSLQMKLLSDLRSVNSKQLVYLEKSPDFCSTNNFEFSGTTGRSCNHSSTGPDSCHKLCCNQQFVTHMEIQDRQCDCKFKWCCHVKCKVCPTPVHVSVCK